MLRGIWAPTSFSPPSATTTAYRDGNAATGDLRQVFEQLSHKSLQEFFAQWLMRAGTPRIEGSWRYDATRKVVEITVTQTQGGEPFRFPLDVSVAGASGRHPGDCTADRRHARMSPVPSACRLSLRLSPSIHPQTFWLTSTPCVNAKPGTRPTESQQSSPPASGRQFSSPNVLPSALPGASITPTREDICSLL